MDNNIVAVVIAIASDPFHFSNFNSSSFAWLFFLIARACTVHRRFKKSNLFLPKLRDHFRANFRSRRWETYNRQNRTCEKKKEPSSRRTSDLFVSAGWLSSPTRWYRPTSKSWDQHTRWAVKQKLLDENGRVERNGNARASSQNEAD